jgi:hypothetical protein
MDGVQASAPEATQHIIKSRTKKKEELDEKRMLSCKNPGAVNATPEFEQERVRKREELNADLASNSSTALLRCRCIIAIPGSE